MPFIIQDHLGGVQPIATTETTKATAHALGDIVKAVDSTYGTGEFIYLKGVASTVVGSTVVWDSSFQTALTGTGSRGPVAVAMSANVANQFGWYQISGLAQVLSAAAVASGAPLQTNATPGTVDDTATVGQYIDGMVAKAAAGGASVLFTAALSRPCCNGR